MYKRQDPNGAVDLIERADAMSDVVAACIQNGYDAALARVEQIIEENGYDYETSLEALINYGSLNPDYEVCYVLAAYSASMGQVGTDVYKRQTLQSCTSIRQPMQASPLHE